MPKVSIIIPTYNQSTLLRKALESVLAQAEGDWEAIVVNNYSDDDTIETVEAFADPRIRRMEFRNDGIIAASRNKALEAATGEWIAFLDSDDLWSERKLEACLRHADDADLICHREQTTKNGQVIRVSPHHQPERADYRRLLFDGNCLSPTAVMVRREAVNRVGGFSERPDFATCEDYDLWLRLAQQGIRVAFVGQVMSVYRLHDANNSASVQRHMNANLSVLENHYAALTEKRPLDGLRYRRCRSMAIYGAARSFQKAGAFADALRHFLRSLWVFPLNLRAAVFGCLSTAQVLARRPR